MQPQIEHQGKDRIQPLFGQLKPRKNVSREVVRAHQRARLHAAMVEAVADKGYAATTVRDVIALAGVSRKTFYGEFANKEDCFVATYEHVVREGMERIQAAYQSGGEGERNWSAGLCRAFDAFVIEIVEHPKPTRFALLDVLVAGPAARGPIEHAEALFAQMIGQSFAQAPDEVAMPRLLLRSLVGGIWFVARSRLMRGQSTAIGGAGEELLRWMLTYRHPVVEALPRCAPVPAAARRERIGCDEDERTRLLRAVAEVAAEGGLAEATPGQVALQAGLDPSAFAEHFESTGDCFFTSLEFMSAESLARALRESEDAPDWSVALCRLVRALLCEVAENRVFARAAFVAVYALGPSGTQRRAELMRRFASVLARRAPEGSEPSALVAEAIVGSVWSMAYRHVLHDRAPMLPSLWPHAAYLALAPIVGAERAVEAIRSELADEPAAARALQPAAAAASRSAAAAAGAAPR